jgi:L-2-hydroxyglutarate oxidase LhgO
VALRTSVLGGAFAPGRPARLQLRADGDEHELEADRVINAAGLGACAVAARFQGLAPGQVPVPRFAKGSYFTLAGRSPFAGLVYPAPVDVWLGVHVTLDLGGQVRFGPDLEWLPAGADPTTLDYAVDPARAIAFADAVRRYWPAMPEAALAPAYSGVRPKIHGPDEPAPDFRIDGPSQHGVAGLVNLFGIESPGLTASLAIAEHVTAMLSD